MRRFTILFILGALVCCAPLPTEDQQGPSAAALTMREPTGPTIESVAAPAGVPQALFNAALTYYQANLKNIPKPQYMTIVDFTKWSGNIRMWIIDMNSGAVEPLHVAHGSGSDPQNTGYATLFGNVPNSYKSSLGFYLTTNITEAGPHGPELVIDGLSPTNSNARARGILVHSAMYVYDNNTKAGRSEGCFAFPQAHRDHVIGELRGGTLLYAGLSGAK